MPQKRTALLVTALWIFACGPLLVLPVDAFAQKKVEQKDAKSKKAKSPEQLKKEKERELTLKNIFPEKSFFGPRPQSPAFSHSGRYATWMHRPHIERRHGDDIYLFDTRSGEITRLTSARIMAEHLSSARKVVEDRKAKARKARKAEKKPRKPEKKASKAEKEKAEQEQNDKDAEYISEKDFEDKKAPRHGGARVVGWSPGKDEFLFTSGGDLFQYSVARKEITRHTRTQETLRGVHYLPDGTGYTHMSEKAVQRVTFGNHLVEQLHPPLDSKDKLRSYELSPDGKRIALVTHTATEESKTDRKVKIVNYRDRFAAVKEVPRHVSDDPIKPYESRIYLHALDENLQEKGKLYKVFTQKVDAPRDLVSRLDWSPDSSRVTFAAFSQKSKQIEIYEAIFPPADQKLETEITNSKEEEQEEEGEGDDAGSVGKKDDEEKKERKKEEEKEGDKTSKEKPEAKKRDDIVERPAKLAYRFLHEGGPNTPRMIHPRYLADNRTILYQSEESGFRHLHTLDPLYQSQRALTKGYFELYPLHLTKDRKHLYVTANKEKPSRLDTYEADLKTGELTRLTTQVGAYNSAAVNAQGKHLLATFSAFGAPRELVHIDLGKKKQKTLTNSHPEIARHFTKAKPQFFEYENRHGHHIHGHLFKPDGKKDKKAKLPLLIYVYGGPLGTRKQVSEGNFQSSSYFFANYMAKKHGYLTCTIDPRGMSGYGAVFEKANFERVGKPQVEDLVDGVKFLIEKHGADPKRVAIHGWSFGGFQTQLCLYTEPEVFQVGMAGAGPTEWENYNSWYSTGTIGNSRTGQTDLKKFSLLPLAKNLKGKLLLIHGMEDPNVLYQDTVRVYRELLKAGKETNVELFLDPTGGHGLEGDIKRLNRFRKYEDFLIRNNTGVTTKVKSK